MSFREGMQYLKCMEVIEADKSLNDVQIATSPNMKDKDRQKLIKRYGSIITRNTKSDRSKEDQTIMTTTEFADYLQGRMNG